MFSKAFVLTSYVIFDQVFSKGDKEEILTTKSKIVLGKRHIFLGLLELVYPTHAKINSMFHYI